MKNLKKILYSLIISIIFNIYLVKNYVQADVVTSYTRNNYTPQYYISIFIVVCIVVVISILILRKIYKDNKKEEAQEGDEN